jgi:hypothetical protein
VPARHRGGSVIVRLHGTQIQLFAATFRAELEQLLSKKFITARTVIDILSPINWFCFARTCNCRISTSWHMHNEHVSIMALNLAKR